MAAECWQWASWFGDDGVCEIRDKMGFAIGLFSVFCWGLAEIPQLVINAVEGSSEGISEGLLWLWVFSDVLDVVGCTLSDTLPTMVITAYMYFIFTLLLLLQHIYYTRVTPRQPDNESDLEGASSPLLSSGPEDDLVAELYGPTVFARSASGTRHHTVYGSLRNLSIRRSSSSTSLSLSDTGRRLHDSFAHRRTSRHRLSLPGGTAIVAAPDRPPTADAATIRQLRSGSLPKSFSGAAAAAKMLVGLTLLALVAGAGLGGSRGSGSSGAATPLLSREPAASDKEFWGISYAVWGSIMGWTMAVTFFFGRVPQVIKNWQRQSCAGLSVEMFAIVLTAAATYCASILLRVRSWSDLAPKLPFFADAALGALLDIVILVQFFIYRNADDSDAARTDSTHKPPAAPASAAPPGSPGNCCKAAPLPVDKPGALLGCGEPCGSSVTSSTTGGFGGDAAAHADVLIIDQARSLDSDTQSMLSIATV